MPTTKTRKGGAAPQVAIIQTPSAMNGLLSPEQVRVGLGNISKPMLYRMIREGVFPGADCYLTDRTPRWSVGLFNRHIENLLAARPKAPATGE